MSIDLPPVAEYVYDEERIQIDTGSCTSGTEVFYWAKEVTLKHPEGWNDEVWRQPIPEEMKLVEAEYYAVLKSLRVAGERGYPKIDIAINSPPILGQLRGGKQPPPLLMPYYEEAVYLMEQFDSVDIVAYAVDMRSSD